VSKALDIEAIKGRAGTLSDAEGAGRLALFMAGKVDWQLGDRIKATLADVKSLVTRVEELEAERANQRDEPSIVGALVGSLRAAGYVIHEPAWGDGSTVAGAEVIAFNHDAAASDMLGEDAIVHPSLAAAERAVDAAHFLTDAEREDVIDEPRICPNCELPLPPDGKCLSPYVDCRSSTSDTGRTPPKLTAGQFVRITDGHWAGRHAIATGEVNDVGAPCVTVVGKSITLEDAIDVERVFVVNPDVDVAAERVCDMPADGEPLRPPRARSRAPEPLKLVTEWAPDGRDFDGYAKDLACQIEDVATLLNDFRDHITDTAPDKKQARWGGTFKAWAKARLTNQA
jgi:hypothetical protein